MKDTRERLPVGTQIHLESGSIYIISSDAIGFGGGSIVYPANRMVLRNGVLVCDEFVYALKECFPVCNEHTFVRNKDGEIVAETLGSAGSAYLEKAKQLQLCEGSVSREIYRTASRMLPVLETSCRATYIFPDGSKAETSNSVTVMESITEKGRSVRSLLSEKRRVSALEAFRIIQQLLFALSEVHNAGFLHLDIQDGNVFLRGSLEDNSEFLTLIDFGAARPMQNGKTTPIADKVIFTSEGFTAPEILLGNDGSLRLGPEADLYSVGCMLMLLLTGHRPNVRTLLYNKSGNYLTQRQLARVGCPHHLVGRLQAILAKALAVDEKDRYHSTDEMLEAVADILHALQPYRTDLSSVVFDAFVCYKHGPIDSAAAVTLQRALENYRAPKDISGKRKPFQRVFVDEGELSSCADFGQQIREALKNSGWLIVICSPDTPSSPWVQLEIDTFLEYHDRSRILAVLTSGEPEESYPPQLKANADGMGEVLAADARGVTAKEVQMLLKKDALLKVAAPMLGTSFDSIKQRQRVYRMQRAAVAASIAMAMTVGFAAYAVNRANVISRQSAEISRQAEEIGQQAQRIEEEYRTSLINESRFLAEQAERRLKENDPIGAVEFALQALPSDTQDRPVIPEAEYVLSKALGVYQTPSVQGNYASLVGLMNPDMKNMSGFFLNEEGNRLFVYGGKFLQVWDTDSLKIIQNIEFSSEIDAHQPQIISGTSRLVLSTYSNLICVDFETGKILWEKETDKLINWQIAKNPDSVVVFHGTGEPYGDCSGLRVAFLSADVGEELSSQEYSLGFEFDKFSIRAISISDDQKWCAALYYLSPSWAQSQDNIAGTKLLILNLEKGTLNCKSIESLQEYNTLAEMAAELQFLGDDLLMLRENSVYGSAGDAYQNEMIAFPAAATVERYDLNTGMRKWSAEYSFYSTGGISSILLSSFQTKEQSLDCALVTIDNLCKVIDLKNGRQLWTYQLESPILDIAFKENGFLTVNSNGTTTSMVYTADYTTNALYSLQQFNSPITNVCRNNNTFYTCDTNPKTGDGKIRKYQMEVIQDNYQLLAEDKEHHWNSDNIVRRNLSENSASFTIVGTDQVWYWDEETQTNCHTDLPDECYSGNILGSSVDEAKLYYDTYNKDEAAASRKVLGVLDLLSGEVSLLEYPEEEPASLIGFCNDCVLYRVSDWDADLDRIYSWNPAEAAPILVMTYPSCLPDKPWNMEDYCNIPNCLRGLSFSCKLDSQGNRIMAPYYQQKLHGEKLGILELNSETGETVDRDITYLLPRLLEEGNWPYDVAYYRSGKAGYLSLSFGNSLYVMDQTGGLLFTVQGDSSDVKAKGVHFLPDGVTMAVSFDNGLLELYELPSGEKRASCDLGEYSISSDTPAVTRWEWTVEGRLLCYSEYEAFLLDISGGDIQVVAVIPSCIAYDPYQNRYLVLDSYYGIGQLNCLSVEEMIARGQMLIGR